MERPGESIRATRPWNSVNALKPITPPHTCDPPPVMEVCKRCAKENCAGDCEDRKQAAKLARKGDGTGVKKNIRMEDVVDAYNELGGKLTEISHRLGVKKSTVRYWLKKAGLKK